MQNIQYTWFNKVKFSLSEQLSLVDMRRDELLTLELLEMAQKISIVSNFFVVEVATPLCVISMKLSVLLALLQPMEHAVVSHL